jgi:LmbE family N-acetylglucosaminyl deacetylase
MKSMFLFAGICISILSRGPACHLSADQPPGKRISYSDQLQAVEKTPTLLAVFAHPDDELLTGAALAHYASRGVKVYVAVATDGALGTTDFSGIPAGKQLAEARHAEMICSAKALGAEPIFIGLPDQLDAEKGQLPRQLDSLRRAIVSLMNTLHPDVVITFGAEGWTGHPDHRLIGIIVTEVFASKRWLWNPKLYFSALPTGTINDSSWAKYLTVDSSYLAVRVPLTAEDYAKLRIAFNCHQTQYRPGVRQRLPVFLEQIQKHTALFRPFVFEGKSNSLFK